MQEGFARTSQRNDRSTEEDGLTPHGVVSRHPRFQLKSIATHEKSIRTFLSHDRSTEEERLTPHGVVSRHPRFQLKSVAAHDSSGIIARALLDAAFHQGTHDGRKHPRELLTPPPGSLPIPSPRVTNTAEESNLFPDPRTLSPGHTQSILEDSLRARRPPPEFFVRSPSTGIIPDDSDISAKWVPNDPIIALVSKRLGVLKQDFAALVREDGCSAFAPGSELLSTAQQQEGGVTLCPRLAEQIMFGGSGFRPDFFCTPAAQLPEPAPHPPTASDREKDRLVMQTEADLAAKGYCYILFASAALMIRSLRTSPYFMKDRPGKSPRPLHNTSASILSAAPPFDSINGCTDMSLLPRLDIGTMLSRLLCYLYILSLAMQRAKMTPESAASSSSRKTQAASSGDSDSRRT